MTAYLYDAHDRLIQLRNPETVTQRFYRHDTLHCEQVNDNRSAYFEAAGQILAQTGGASGPTLLASDRQQSVFASINSQRRRQWAYGLYGQRNAANDINIGFNGEPLDPTTGRYCAGNGYRTYDPQSMRFHSPDSLSPFGAGGLNPYAYCQGDPINFVDPTGHLSTGAWINIALGLAFTAIGVGITVLTMGAGTAPFALTAANILAGVSIATGVTSAATSIASIVTAETQPDSGVSAILGYVSLGFGVASLASGIATGAMQAGQRIAKAFASGLSGHARSVFSTVDQLDNLSGPALRQAVRNMYGKDLHRIADSSPFRAAKIFPHLRRVKSALQCAPNESPLEAVFTHARALKRATRIMKGNFRGVMRFQLNEAGIPPLQLPAVTATQRATQAQLRAHDYMIRTARARTDQLHRSQSSYLF